MALKLLNECLFYNSPLFCSSVYQWQSSQYFKIVVVHFLSRTCKTCSSLSYMCFSFSRFMRIDSKSRSNKYFRRFNKLSMKKFTLSFILFGAVLTLYKLFQYRVNRIQEPQKLFPYEIHDEISCKEQKNRHICQLITSLKILDSATNDILFFVLCLTIDCYLFVTFKKEIEQKKKVSTIKVDDLDKKQEDLTKMIIVNGVIYFVSHSPEFVSSVLLIIFAHKISNICMFKISCDIINENAQFFSLVAITFQFFVFKRFDQNFKSSYIELESKLFEK